jgi:hypothetical protein
MSKSILSGKTKSLKSKKGGLSRNNDSVIVEEIPTDSVELSVNAKGEWSGKVKCYGFDEDQALKKAFRGADRMINWMKRQ